MHSCRELEVGATVEARAGRAVHFSGTVAETMPGMELFWAVSPAGERRILEFAECQIYLLGSGPEAAEGAAN
ncbi:hypothetical protein GCM10028789_28520 [Sinomonas halotolerans]